jgi:hypothetical protein
VIRRLSYVAAFAFGVACAFAALWHSQNGSAIVAAIATIGAAAPCYFLATEVDL